MYILGAMLSNGLGGAIGGQMGAQDFFDAGFELLGFFVGRKAHADALGARMGCARGG